MDARHAASAALATLMAAGGTHGRSVGAMRVESGRQFLKASPSIEGGQRILYMEASREMRDLQGERILVQALEDSIAYFLRFGKIDLDHATVTGQIRGQKVNPYAFEIGRPIDVRVDRTGAVPSIFVKAAIFKSKGGENNSFTEAADLFWDSLYTDPPAIWYPSVQGYVIEEDPVLDGDGRRTQQIRRLQWHSIGLSRTPVNHNVDAVSTMALPVFAKAFTDAGDIKRILADLGAPHITNFDPDKLMAEPNLDDVTVKTVLEAIATSAGGPVGPAILGLVDSGSVSVEAALHVLLALTDSMGGSNG
jgi:hypothetical protein